MKPALTALEQLMEGNRRFASDIRAREGNSDQARRNELAERQEPFAIRQLWQVI